MQFSLIYFRSLQVPGDGAYLHERVNRSTPNYAVLISHSNQQLLSYRSVIDGKLSYL